MIKTVSTGIAIVVALGLFAEAAGQSIDRGTLSGTVFSAGATVPNLSQAFVTTTPDDRAFVLTQVCTTHPNALRLNAGAIIGDIPLERSTNCTQYIPGIAIPPRTNINCFDHAGARGNLRCMLTGVLTPSVVPPPAAGVKASFDPAVSFTGSSASTSPRKLIETRSFDHGWEADMGALDFLSKSLQDEPDSTGYTFIYGARRGYRNDVVRRMECMKNYLLQRRGIPAGRLRVINGGYREHATVELWVAPNGSAAPVPRPSVSPKNVRFKQGGTRYTCNV